MATQKVFCSYQEIIDLHTDTNKVTALGIHTPIGKTPQKMFGGFFDQFKKYKYLGCAISLVPAATLPVDPLQVSYDNPNDAVDPRDILNPILFHGCHGEDIGSILNNLYALGLANTGLMGPSTDSMDRLDFPQDEASGLDLMEKLYYKALTDNTWLKAHPQRGFRKAGLRPLVYKVNATHQIMPSDPDEIDSLEYLKGMGAPVTELMNRTPTSFYVRGRHEAKSLQFVANKLTSLGWLDTRNVIASGVKTTPDFVDPTKLNENLAEVLNAQTVVAELPKIFMGVILLSPSYQCIQHYRLICQHRFAFAGFRGISFNPSFSSPDEDSPANFTGPDSEWPSDNGFGSGGDDDNGGDDEPIMSLSGAVTLGFTPEEGTDVALYSKLTIEGDEYTVTGSQQFGSYTCGFVLHDGKVYIGGQNSGGTELVYITGSSSGYFVRSSGSGTTSVTASMLAISPTDAELYADLVDGGIEYDGE